MDDLKFNLYALVNPQTPAEFAALLEEAARVMEDLVESVTELEAALHLQAAGRGKRAL